MHEVQGYLCQELAKLNPTNNATFLPIGVTSVADIPGCQLVK